MAEETTIIEEETEVIEATTVSIHLLVVVIDAIKMVILLEVFQDLIFFVVKWFDLINIYTWIDCKEVAERCYRCNQSGHLAKDCENEVESGKIYTKKIK